MLGLGPGKVAHVGAVAEGALAVALVVGAGEAEEAAAAGGVKAAEHSVAALYPGHLIADLGDPPDELVADREPGLDLDPPVVDVQVRAADATGLDPDDRVLGRVELLDRGGPRGRPRPGPGR